MMADNGEPFDDSRFREPRPRDWIAWRAFYRFSPACRARHL
jgi:hypothetical protein